MTLGAYWLAFVLVVLAGWCAIPVERTLTAAPTVTPTLRVVVLPTATSAVFSAPTREVVILDQLPIRATSTRVPTPEPSVTPTVTPVPPTPSQRPVQRGLMS